MRISQPKSSVVASPERKAHVQDDNSTSTPPTGVFLNEKQPEMKEIVLEFSTTDPKTADQFGYMHICIISDLQLTFTKHELRVFENNGKELKTIEHADRLGIWTAKQKQRQHFRVGTIIGNVKKKRANRYVIKHRIRTTKNLRELKEASITLSQTPITLRSSPWTEDVIDVVRLGFLSGIHTTYQTTDEALQLVRTIANTQQLPPIRIVFSSPRLSNQTGRLLRTKAYSIECRRTDTEKVKNILSSVFQNRTEAPFLLFERMKYQQPENYAKGIKIQTKLLQSQAAIKLSGVGLESLYYLDNWINSIKGVHYVTKRWNYDKSRDLLVIVDANRKAEIIDSLSADLLNHYTDQVPIDARLDESQYGEPRTHDNELSSTSSPATSISSTSMFSIDTDDVEDDYTGIPANITYAQAVQSNNQPTDNPPYQQSYQGSRPSTPSEVTIPQTADDEANQQLQTLLETTRRELESARNELATIRQERSELMSQQGSLQEELRLFRQDQNEVLNQFRQMLQDARPSSQDSADSRKRKDITQTPDKPLLQNARRFWRSLS